MFTTGAHQTIFFLLFFVIKTETAPGQSLEQTLASPVIRMQPVMQQTNVIHVAQGGTVILPSGNAQNTQINQNAQQSPQAVQNISHMNFAQNQQMTQTPFFKFHFWCRG